MYSCMVFLLVLWLSVSRCSGITVKRLERRVNHLESRVHDDSMSFRDDLDKLYAIVNDTRVDGKHQPNEGNTTEHCAEPQQSTVTDDNVRRFQRDIDQQMNAAKRGMVAEKAWLREKVERVENNVTLLTQDITDHVATVAANLAEIKQPLEQKLDALSGEIDAVKVNITDHVSTLKLAEIKGDLDARCETLENKLNSLTKVVDTVKEKVHSNENEFKDDLDARCETLENKLDSLTKVVDTVKEKVQSNENEFNAVVEKQLDNIAIFISFYENIRNTDKYTVKSHAGKLYAFSSDLITWSEAVAECQSIGAYLVEINSPAENTFIGGGFGGYHWIGASDAAEEGKWIWNHSKEPITTAFWGDGEPNNYYSMQDCAMIRNIGYGYKWYDTQCDFKSRYVCEAKYSLTKDGLNRVN